MSSLNENFDNANTEDVGEVPNNDIDKGSANLKEANHEDDNDESTESENDIEDADEEELDEEELYEEEYDEKEDEEEGDKYDKAENHKEHAEVEKADYNANKVKKGKTNTGNIKQSALMPSAHAARIPAVVRVAGNKKIAVKKVEKTKKKETLAENMLKRNGAALIKHNEETAVVKPKMRKLAPMASTVMPKTAFKTSATAMAIPELFEVAGKVPIKNNNTTKRVSTQTMVDTAIKNLNERAGSSLYAIKKYIMCNYPNVEPIGSTRLFLSIKKYIKKALETGNLIQKRGSGLTGSFKLADPKTASKAKAVKEKQKKKLKQTIKALKEKDNEKAIEKQNQKQQPLSKINVAVVKQPRKGGENMAAKTAATTKSKAVPAEPTKSQPAAKKHQATGKTVKEKENTNTAKKEPANAAAKKVAAGPAVKKKEPHVAKAKPAPASTAVAKPAGKVKPKK